MIKNLKQYNEPSREAFLNILLLFRSDRNSGLFRTDFPDFADFEDALTIRGQNYASTEERKVVIEIFQLFKSYYKDTKGLSMYPFSAEGILFMVDSIIKS